VSPSATADCRTVANNEYTSSTKQGKYRQHVPMMREAKTCPARTDRLRQGEGRLHDLSRYKQRSGTL
jgi:hypothetical protein